MHVHIELLEVSDLNFIVHLQLVLAAAGAASCGLGANTLER
jgi:hypothetical protein